MIVAFILYGHQVLENTSFEKPRQKQTSRFSGQVSKILWLKIKYQYESMTKFIFISDLCCINLIVLNQHLAHFASQSCL